VSEAGAGEWAGRLLFLSPALVGGGEGTAAEVVEGLQVTGHFLETHLAPSLGDRRLPPSRARLVDLLARAG
jgi:DNA repair protein RecO (recombination protein O)